MNLLLIDREYPPNPHGGIGTYNLFLANSLGKLGHFVVVLSCTEKKDLQITETPYGILFRIPYRPVSGTVAKYLRWIDQIVFGWKIVPYALHLTKDFNIDICEIPSAGGYGAFIAKYLKKQVPVITRFHGSLGRVPIDKATKHAYELEMRKMGQSVAKRKLGNFLNTPQWSLENNQLKHSYQVTCPSEFSRRWLSQQRRINREKFVVIPNGIDVGQFLPYRNVRLDNMPYHQKIILFVGRCSVAKGVSVLARAVPKILNQVPDAAIWFAGPLTDPRVASRLSELSSIYSNRVKVLGRLPHQKIMSLLSKSSLLIHPTFYETSSMVAMEAMALGVPVVASNTGPLPEIVKDQVTGALFKTGDEEALAKSVLALLNSDENISKMNENSMLHVNNFDINQTMKTIVKSYEKYIKEFNELRQ